MGNDVAMVPGAAEGEREVTGLTNGGGSAIGRTDMAGLGRVEREAAEGAETVVSRARWGVGVSGGAPESVMSLVGITERSGTEGDVVSVGSILEGTGLEEGWDTGCVEVGV